MNALETRHPEDGVLLRYADGELAPREAAQVRSHLEACWQCRSELEELGAVVGECVRYRKFLGETLPPPPAPWSDLAPGFAAVDASLARPHLLARFGRWLLPPAPLRWAALAAALALAAFFAGEMRNPPPARAAELLMKAVAAAEAHPGAPRRIAIRTQHRHMTRWLGVPAGAASTTAPADFVRELAALEALFAKSNYNWEDPLSARSFQAWRDALPQKRDEVESAAGADGWHLIRTSTRESELAAASLKLRAADLRPVEGRFEFRNHEWVEISELPVQPGLAVEAAPAHAGTPLPAPAPEARALETAARPPATLGEELQVLAALQRVGADLGDPVEVTRDGGRIVVRGLGLDDQRRRQIEQALRPLEHVVVQLSEAPPAPPEDAARPPDISVRAEAGGWASRIERHLGGRAQFEATAARILDHNELMMSRAYALRRLAGRFPEAAESVLGDPDRRLLLSLHQAHAAHLAAHAAELDGMLQPLLQSLGAAAAPLPMPAAAPWQAATREAFEAARSVERLLARFLGGAGEEGADPGLPRELAARLAALRAAAENCRRSSAGAAP